MWRALLLVLALAPRAWASSCDELVREGRAHELAREDEIAVKRYTDAITLDGTCEGAYGALAEVRLRQGDGREAERVAKTALSHLPSARRFVVLSARAKWLQGRKQEAEDELASYLAGATFDDARDAVKELSAWLASERKAPAQLAIWRRFLALAEEQQSANEVREARVMVKALMLLVAEADPVQSTSSPARKVIAAAARR